MAEISITSEYFCKFDSAARDVLTNAGHTVIDNPYGHQFLSSEEIIPHCKTADAFICDLEKINQTVIDSAPNLKIISRRGVGVDSVDVEYAAKKNITVARTLGVVEPPVSELVLGYILAFSRNIDKHSHEMHNGKWSKIESHSVNEKTLGIVGMGKIGYEVAKRAYSFGMNIVYSDMYQNERCENDFQAKKLTFDELLAKADFVTVHTPLTEETKGLFGYETLCKMKRGAFLINTARGAVVEEGGLYKAVTEEKIAGAAIDVFDVEPKENSILNALPEVILTPHIGTFTKEIFIKMDLLAAQNIVEYFKGTV